MNLTAPAHVVISTSRRPSHRTRSLCKELQLVLPSAHYLQRGKRSFEEVLQASREAEGHLLLMVGERDGNPGSLALYLVNQSEKPVLSLQVHGVKLAREYGSHVRSRSKALRIAADSSETSNTLGRQLETYLESELYARNGLVGSGIRILSIAHMGYGKVRLTFKDSESGRELGPSITGG